MRTKGELDGLIFHANERANKLRRRHGALHPDVCKEELLIWKYEKEKKEIT